MLWDQTLDNLPEPVGQALSRLQREGKVLEVELTEDEAAAFKQLRSRGWAHYDGRARAYFEVLIE